MPGSKDKANRYKKYRYKESLRDFMRRYKEANVKNVKGGFSGLQKPYRCSVPLSDMIGITVGSRTQIMKLLWKYVKDRNLQDPTDRRFILPDMTMSFVFGGERIRGFCMSKFIRKHLSHHDFLEDTVACWSFQALM